MSNWKRRLRGILGAGTIWGAIGGILGLSGGVLGAILDTGGILIWVGSLGLGFAGCGFLMGCGFGAMMAAIEGRKSPRELSARRVAA